VILESLEIAPEELERRTGWVIMPEGACKADRCVPLPPSDGEALSAEVLAKRLGMALVHDEGNRLWALGPESGGRALLSAEMPELMLPDRNGNPFSLRSLLGTKVALIAWASW
jgi:hypothetical protein